MQEGAWRLWTAIAWLGAMAVAALLTIPAVWWDPLQADEIVTLELGRLGVTEILDEVFVERGGAPLHFLVAAGSLTWPDGLEGLRLPSVVFFLLALPAAGLVARRLVDVRAAVALPLALACAPLAVGLATFGRMYSLLLAATLWATVVALWAARRNSLLGWALAGIAAGLLAYIHPAGPLYSALVVATGLLAADVPFRRLLRVAWAAPLTLALVQAPYYAVALGTLLDRYGVEPGAPRPRTLGAAGRSVPEDGLLGLGPGELAGSLFLLGLVLAGVAWLAWDRPRTAVALALWGLVPVAFFAFVPAGGGVFHQRYLLPALPFVLLLAVAGCLGLASFGRVGAAAGALLFAGLLAWQLADVVQDRADLRDLRLVALAAAAEEAREPAVVFDAVGEPPFADRSAGLLDDYVLLGSPGLARAPEHDPDALAAFVAGEEEPATGVWIFAGSPSQTTAARGRLVEVGGAKVVAVSPSVLLVRSAEPLEPRPLVELSAELRDAWLAAVPDDLEAERLLRRARYALGA